MVNIIKHTKLSMSFCLFTFFIS